MVLNLLVLFFFKQKTAYEMRISDWSSDVCSSDLRRFYQSARLRHVELHRVAGLQRGHDAAPVLHACRAQFGLDRLDRAAGYDLAHLRGTDASGHSGFARLRPAQLGAAPLFVELVRDRRTGAEGNLVAVRVSAGGRGFTQNKTRT